MHKFANCILTDEQMAAWTNNFVPESEPYFFVNKEIHSFLSQQAIKIYTKSEFFDTCSEFIFNHGSVYHVWAIPQNSYVMIAGKDELKRLTPQIRKMLFEEQVHLRRGQIYAIKWIEKLNRNLLHLFSGKHTLKDNDEIKIILTRETWSIIPFEFRKCWLVQWLSDRIELEGVGIDASDELEIPVRSQGIINKFRGTFSNESGANCFAATSSAMTGIESTIFKWMKVNEFYNSLLSQGYQKLSELRLNERDNIIRPDDVLVWINDNGETLHAAYALNEKYVFNKNGQFWHQPWQVLSIENVFDYGNCLSNGGQIAIYRRS